MSDVGYAVGSARRVPSVRRRGLRLRRTATAASLWIVLLGNTAAIVWLWVKAGNVTDVHGSGEVLTSLARITGLLSAYSALIQVLLLARIPWLERLAGFDRLSVWHRVNGKLCILLVLAHVVLSVWGYALMDRISLPSEVSTMLTSYPGMITATVGTALLVGVVISSLVIVRRRLRYEAWYAVHLASYAGIALAWFHQIPTGNELVLDRVAAGYWRGLYLATLALLVGFRVVQPILGAVRHRLRVAEVVSEGPGVVSLRITGRRLDRLRASGGQFFLWRFLTRGRWWASHPFSLSAAPDGNSLRITVKALGDFTSRLGEVAPGTRVIAEGPFGVFTDAARRRAKTVLIGGGIGVTPIRALLEEMDGDLVVIYRVVHDDDAVLRDARAAPARERGATLLIVAGDHATPEGRLLLSSEHLRQLVPDLTERDVFVCGPPAMATAIERNVRGAGVPRRHIHTERFAL